MTEALNALAANIVSRHKARSWSRIFCLSERELQSASGCSGMLTLAEDLLRSHDLYKLSLGTRRLRRLKS